MWAKIKYRLLAFLISTALASTAWATADSILVNDLRIKLGQTTAANSNWTEAQLVRCFQMAQAEISALGRAIEKWDTLAGGSLVLDTVSNEDSLNDFITLKGSAYLWRNGQEIRGIPKVSMDSLNAFMDYIQTQSFGVDRYVIAEDGGNVMVAPILNSADSVIISYYGRPAAFVDDGTENSFSDEWEQVLLASAYVIALQKINSPMLTFAVSERDKMIAAMFQSLTLRPQLGSRATQ